jgi:lipoprotein-anchoring transpeptidase ErfK/SrfK
MYFSNGQAFHGEPNGLPGYNASHGCVRLYVRDAEWLRYDFVEPPDIDNDYRGTKVIVKPY